MVPFSIAFSVNVYQAGFGSFGSFGGCRKKWGLAEPGRSLAWFFASDISEKASETTYPLVMTNIAMEHGPFTDGLPIKNDDFPWLCYITRWYIYIYI